MPLGRDAVAEHIRSLSTRATFDQFVHDFARNAGVQVDAVTAGPTLELRLGDALDFLTRKDYADNWLSESHEQFSGLAYADWVSVIETAGFSLGAGSRAWRNDWVIENRIAPVASLGTLDGSPLARPVTHLLTVASTTDPRSGGQSQEPVLRRTRRSVTPGDR